MPNFMKGNTGDEDAFIAIKFTVIIANHCVKIVYFMKSSRCSFEY